ncbi:MAG: class I SAM-dependent methyltransferase [Pseudomonadota bacterium]
MPHLDQLVKLYDLSNRDVVDIGAGNGANSSAMAGQGARVTGIEVSPEAVARAVDAQGDKIRMLEGRAEALPLKDDSQDLATFFFSLHHVPADVHDQAFEEVSRVLRPQGRLHVVEPLPEGTMFETIRPVDDETEVRRTAISRLDSMADSGTPFELIDKSFYPLKRTYETFEEFVDDLIAVDPVRAARLPTVRGKMESRFIRTERIADGETLLIQPCVAYHFALT